MDLSTEKHNVIAIHHNELRLWDTATNKSLVSYGDMGFEYGRLSIKKEEIKCNSYIMMVRFDYGTVHIYDIYTGATIDKLQQVNSFNICDTHMAMSYYGKKQVIEITDLQTMKKMHFNHVIDLHELCINSKHIAGLEFDNRRLKVFDFTKKKPNVPIIDVYTNHNRLIMNKNYIFLMSVYGEHCLVSIISLAKKIFVKNDILIQGGSCRMHLNPINDTVYVSVWRTLSDIQIISFDPQTLKQKAMTYDTGNFAIGTAIATCPAIPDNPHILWGNGANYTDNLIIHHDDKKITYKNWETNNKYFELIKVVLDINTYVKKLLIKHIIPDISIIVLAYLY